MLTKDSSFIEQREAFNAQISPTVDSLRKLVDKDPQLTRRVNELYRLIRKRLMLQNLNLQKVPLNDSVGLRSTQNEESIIWHLFGMR